MKATTVVALLAVSGLVSVGLWFLATDGEGQRRVAGGAQAVGADPGSPPPSEEGTGGETGRAEASPVAAAGPTLRVLVRLTDALRGGRAVAGVQVSAGLGRNGDAPGAALVAGRTDAEGRVRLEVPTRADQGLADCYLWAMPTQAGFQERRSALTAPEVLSAETPPELTVLARPGVTLRGILRDTRGEPCAGELWLERSNSGRWGATGRASAGAKGRFELPLEEAGQYRLYATGPQEEHTGTALVGPFTVDPTRGLDPLEVHLVGPGHIRGRVVDPAGEPLGSLEVAVQLREVGGPTGDRGDGFAWRQGVTDAAGRFDFPGLRDAAYFVRARRAGEAQGRRFPIMLVPEAVPSDGRVLELTLH